MVSHGVEADPRGVPTLRQIAAPPATDCRSSADITVRDQLTRGLGVRAAMFLAFSQLGAWVSRTAVRRTADASGGTRIAHTRDGPVSDPRADESGMGVGAVRLAGSGREG